MISSLLPVRNRSSIGVAAFAAVMLLLGSANAQHSGSYASNQQIDTSTKAALARGAEIADNCLNNDGGDATSCFVFGTMEFLDTPVGHLMKAGYYWVLWSHASKTILDSIANNNESALLDPNTRTGQLIRQGTAYGFAMAYSAIEDAAQKAGLALSTICSGLGRDDCDKLNMLSTKIEQDLAKKKIEKESEMSLNDLVLQQVSRCWNVPAGARDAGDLVVEIRIQVNPDGMVEQATIVDQSRLADLFFRAAAESARRAFFNPQCQPLRLPREQSPPGKTS